MMGVRPSEEDIKKVKELRTAGLGAWAIARKLRMSYGHVAWILGWLRMPIRARGLPVEARVYHINKWGMVKIPDDVLTAAGLHKGDEVVWSVRKGGLFLTHAKKTLPRRAPESEVGVLTEEAARMEERLREAAREERLTAREA